MKKITLIIMATTFFSMAQAQDDYSISQASGKFALNLYKQFAQNSDDNIFFSPLSLNIAMGMTYAGANNETKEQIAQVFNYPADDTNLHKQLGKMQKDMAGLKSKGVEIAIANQLWADKLYKFNCRYIQDMKKAYAAPVKRMAFRTQPEACRLEINRWVENQTNDRIKDLLPGGSISDMTTLVLTNAIYFKGLWEEKFKPERTSEEEFMVSERKRERCMMMNVNGKYRLYQGSDIQLLELPYSGKNFSMLILLPNEGVPLRKVEHSITLENLNSYIDWLVESDVRVKLPRFKFESEYQLKPFLTVMGMPIPFSNGADFTRMSSKPDLKIDEVYHKAFIEVTEEGTEAAAATAVVIVRKSMPISVDFFANRPFMFFIRENATGNILFMGRVNNTNA